jgi:hypothetical protein
MTIEKDYRDQPEDSFFLTELKKCEEALLRTNDQIHVLHAIAVCATSGQVIPEWATKQFLKSYYAIVNRRAASWDDVFGRPLEKRQRLETARRHRLLGIQVKMQVQFLRDKGEPLDEYLFEGVGNKLGIGKTLVSQLWYGKPKRLPR